MRHLYLSFFIFHCTILQLNIHVRIFTSLHCIALHCTALHCIALHCIALHCIVLYCIVLYYEVCYLPLSHTLRREKRLCPSCRPNGIEQEIPSFLIGLNILLQWTSFTSAVVCSQLQTNASNRSNQGINEHIIILLILHYIDEIYLILPGFT